MSKLARFICTALMLLAALAAYAMLHGCGYLPGDEVSDTELAYRAALLRCVDKAKTLPESKACRKQVDAEVLGGQDGGK